MLVGKLILFYGVVCHFGDNYFEWNGKDRINGRAIYLRNTY